VQIFGAGSSPPHGGLDFTLLVNRRAESQMSPKAIFLIRCTTAQLNIALKDLRTVSRWGEMYANGD
jgi:hypothetical protein